MVQCNVYVYVPFCHLCRFLLPLLQSRCRTSPSPQRSSGISILPISVKCRNLTALMCLYSFVENMIVLKLFSMYIEISTRKYYTFALIIKFNLENSKEVGKAIVFTYCYFSFLPDVPRFIHFLSV